MVLQKSAVLAYRPTTTAQERQTTGEIYRARMSCLGFVTAYFTFVLLISVIAGDMVSTDNVTLVFASEPQNITTLQGQSVRFVCRVRNLQTWQKLMWRHTNGNQEVLVALDNRLLVIGGARSVAQEEDGRASILSLQSTTTDQEGTYACVVSGTGHMQINHLTVNVPATIVTTEPRDSNLNIVQGRPFYLSCTAEGKPDPGIAWLKQGQKAFVGENLAVAEASKEDGGIYTCVADNGAGDPTSKQFNVNVQYGPSVVVLTPVVRLRLHQRATLECVFESNPPVGQVTWSKAGDSVDIENNIVLSRENRDDGHVVARLQILNSNTQDVGDYTCDGDNGIGSASDVISVSGLPYDLQVTSDGQSRFSDQYTVRWSVRSESTLDEAQIDLDLDEEEQSNSSETSQKKQVAIRMTSVDQQLPVYIQDFVLKELRPNSSYKLKLRVSNAFGFTNWTEEFRFDTADEGNEAPLSTTLGTTPIRVNLADDDSKRHYTRHQIREPYGAGSLESSSSSSFYSFASFRTLVLVAIIPEVLCWILFR